MRRCANMRRGRCFCIGAKAPGEPRSVDREIAWRGGVQLGAQCAGSVAAQGLCKLDGARERGFQYARVRGRGKCCGTFTGMWFKIFYQNSFVLNNKEDMAMILVLACLFSFLTGAGIALAAQEFMLRREGNGDHVAETVTEIPQEQAAELREQWVNFLSYDGSDQNGGF